MNLRKVVYSILISIFLLQIIMDVTLQTVSAVQIDEITTSKQDKKVNIDLNQRINPATNDIANQSAMINDKQDKKVESISEPKSDTNTKSENIIQQEESRDVVQTEIPTEKNLHNNQDNLMAETIESPSLPKSLDEPKVTATLPEFSVDLRSSESVESTVPVEITQSFREAFSIQIQIDNIDEAKDVYVDVELPIGMLLTSGLDNIVSQYPSVVSYDDSQFGKEILGNDYQPRSGKVSFKIDDSFSATNFTLTMQPDELLWDTFHESSITSDLLAIKVKLRADNHYLNGVQLDRVNIKEEMPNRGVIIYQGEEGSQTGIIPPKIGANNYRLQVRTPLGSNLALTSFSAYKMVAYLPYVRVREGNQYNYISAELDTEKMDNWISKNPHVSYSTETTEDGRILLTYEFQQQVYSMRKDLMFFYNLPEEKFEAYYDQRIFYYTIRPMFYGKGYYDQDFFQFPYGSSSDVITSPGMALNTIISDKSILNLRDTTNSGSDVTYIPKEKQILSQMSYFQLDNQGPKETTATLNWQFDLDDTKLFGVSTIRLISSDLHETFNFECVMEDYETGEKYTGTIEVPKTDLSGQNYLSHRLSKDYVLEKLGVDKSRWKEIYFKQLRYSLMIPGNYNGWASGVRKATGGNFYGVTYKEAYHGETNEQFRASLAIEDYNGELIGNVSKRETTTNIIKQENSQSAYYFSSFDFTNKETNEPIENKDTLINGSQVSVASWLYMNPYPYQNTNYIEEPVVLIRVPAGMRLDLDSVKFTQGKNLNLEIAPPVILKDSSRVYRVQPTDSLGLGYFKSNLASVTPSIRITYDMAIEENASPAVVDIRGLLFATSEKIPSYAKLQAFTEDKWGVANYQDDLNVAFAFEDGEYQLATHIKEGNFSIVGQINLIDVAGERKLAKENDAQWSDTNTPLVLSDKNNQVDYRVILKNNDSKGKIDQSGFYYYIPIAKQNLDNSWVNKQNDFGLQLTGPIQFSGEQSDKFEAYYTTKRQDFDNGEANALEEDGYYPVSEFVEGKQRWQDVTMIKLLIKPNAEVIGKIHIELFLRFSLDFSSQNIMNTYAKAKISWAAYGQQRYQDAHGGINEAKQRTNTSGLRIKYIDQKEVKLTAFKGDQPPEGYEGEKTALLDDLPKFIYEHDVKITELKTDQVTLVEPEKFNEELNVTESNNYFAVNMGVVGDQDTSLAQVVPPADFSILKENQISKIHFQLHHADYLTDALTARYVIVKLTADDDVELEIKINIHRIITQVGVDNGIEAGKQYVPFVPKKITKITNQSAVTGQIILTYLAANFGEPELHLSEKLPTGTSVLIKAVDIDNVDNKIPIGIPQYGYHIVNSQTDKILSMSKFKDMQTGQPFLDEVINGDKFINKGFIFIIDFSAVSAEDRYPNNSQHDIKIYVPAIDEGIPLAYQLGTYTISSERSFAIYEDNLEAGNVYRQNEPIPLEFAVQAEKLPDLTAIDTFNIGKKINLEVKLLKDGKPILLPRGSFLKPKDGKISPVSALSDRLIISNIIDIDESANLINERYIGTLHTLLDSLEVGEYQWQITSYNNPMTTHFLNGIKSAEWKSPMFKIISKSNSGLRIFSENNNRLIYTESRNQYLQLVTEYTDIVNIHGEIYKLNETEDLWDTLFNSPNELSVSDNSGVQSINLEVKNNLSTQLVDEYELLFTATKGDGTTFKVPYRILIGNPENHLIE